MRRLLAVLALYLAVNSCMVGFRVPTIYYVDRDLGMDTNPGTIVSPFKTAHHCIIVVVAGDTCYLRAGDYRVKVADNESISIGYNQANRGTSWSNKITIAPYPGETVNWTSEGFGDSVVMMQIGGGPDILDYYWEIGAFIFHADGAFNVGFPGTRTSGYAVEGSNANYIRFNGSTMTYSLRSCIAPSVHNGQNYWEFISVRATYCGDGTISTPDHGLYWSSSHLLVDGGEYDHNSSYGIQIFKGGETDLNDIVIRNAKLDYNYWGDHVNTGGGGGTVQANGHDHTLYNNLVFNNLSDGIIFNYGCVNCASFNNTVTGNTDCGISSGNGGASNTGINFTNNIAWNNGTNLCYPGTMPTLANNFTSDPSFTAGTCGDYNLLTGSGARSYGMNVFTMGIAGLLTDFAGVARPNAASDAGACQFGAPPPPAMTSGNRTRLHR